MDRKTRGIRVDRLRDLELEARLHQDRELAGEVKRDRSSAYDRGCDTAFEVLPSSGTIFHFQGEPY